MTPDLATRVTQNLHSRYARLRRGCWRLLRRNADLRGQLALTEATATMTLRVSVDLAAELRERNARIAELEAQLAAASQPVERVPTWSYEGRAQVVSVESRRMSDRIVLSLFDAPILNAGRYDAELRLWRPLEEGESDASSAGNG